MTKRELARLEGQIYGLKALMAQCLGALADKQDEAIYNTLVAGIENTARPELPRQLQQDYIDAASATVSELLNAVAVSLRPASSRTNVQ